MPLWIAGKLALYVAMTGQGISNSGLARRLGVRETVVRRMLDPDHDTRSEKIPAALEALGKAHHRSHRRRGLRRTPMNPR